MGLYGNQWVQESYLTEAITIKETSPDLITNKKFKGIDIYLETRNDKDENIVNESLKYLEDDLKIFSSAYNTIIKEEFESQYKSDKEFLDSEGIKSGSALLKVFKLSFIRYHSKGKGKNYFELQFDGTGKTIKDNIYGDHFFELEVYIKSGKAEAGYMEMNG